MGLLAVLLAAAAGGRLAWLVAEGRFSWSRDGLPLLPLVALSLLTIGSLAWLRRWLRSRLGAFVFEAAGGVDVPAAVRRLRVSQLVDLLQLRLASLLAMSRSVFMKSIRDLRYRAVYADRRYKRRIVANLIYELAAAGRPGSAGLPDWLEPSEEMRSIAGSAKRMPTILWFQTPEQLPAVVACGRHTACYNLLVHLYRRYGPELDGADAATREVFGRARALWQRFQEAPLAATSAALEPEAGRDPATAGERDSLKSKRRNVP